MKRKLQKYILLWEARCYPNGIPDEAPEVLEKLAKVPSYRAIVRAIIKNDVQLQTLGYSRIKCRYYNELKRIELKDRGIIKDDNQLKLSL